VSNPSFIYFGGEPIGIPVLEELAANDLLPQLIICSPDKPVGRKQVVTPPPVKVWAQQHAIDVWQPETWRGDQIQAVAQAKLAAYEVDLYVVAAYNHILPQWLIDLAPQGVINVHPSLLPKLRGASPIRTAIKDNLPADIGASIMLLDAEMDHGPLLAQEALPISDSKWPLPGPELDEALGHLGGALLADTLPRYLAGEIVVNEQDHHAATYCSRLTKADSQLELDPCALPRGEAARHAWRVINAFIGMGDAWFEYRGTRIKINEAQLVNDQLRLVTITPAGKPPQSFSTWHQANCTGSNTHSGLL